MKKSVRLVVKLCIYLLINFNFKEDSNGAVWFDLREIWLRHF